MRLAALDKRLVTLERGRYNNNEMGKSKYLWALAIHIKTVRVADNYKACSEK